MRNLVLAGLLLALSAPVATAQTADSRGVGGTAHSVSDRAVRETVELHDFLADWFSGRVPQSESGFARFETAIADDFSMVGPSGQVTDRMNVLAAVYGDWGRWRDDPKAGIEVKNARLRQQGHDLIVVTYEEWQTTASGPTVRTSTVVFRQHSGAPLGLQWVHLHETSVSAE